MIELIEVTKRYGTKLAVDRLNLALAAGEMFAFLGPNGAGKTTTIKMLCGLLFPTHGTVRVGGFDLQADGDQARRLIAFVPDTPFLYEKLTGREFLRFIADMYGMPRDRGRARRRRSGVVNNGGWISCGRLDALRKQADLQGTLEGVFLKLTEEAAVELPAT